MFVELGDPFSPSGPAVVCPDRLAEFDRALEGRPGLGSAIGAWADSGGGDFLVLAELGVIAQVPERDRVKPDPTGVIVKGYGGDAH